MRRRISSRGGLVLLFAGLIGAVHSEAVLTSSQSSVEAGKTLPLKGEKFSKGETFKLVLLGALNEYTLREVEAGADSTFSIELEVPVEVRPGQYQLVAYAPDGDRAATLDLSVLAVASGSSDAVHGEAGEHTEAMVSGARADEMPIERSMAGASWGLIGLLVGLAGGLGVALLRGTASVET